MKFRRKPIIVEAEQWFPDQHIEGVSWPVHVHYDGNVSTDCHDCKDVAVIETLEGTMFIKPGDWIVTGVKGEKWAVRPDIFWETYDLIPENQGC